MLKLHKATNRNTRSHILTLPNGAEILFSYETPVAFRVRGGERVWYKTPTRYSRTTSRHIGEVAFGPSHVFPTQEAFDAAIAALTTPRVEV
jgi:hypothetical protein